MNIHTLLSTSLHSYHKNGNNEHTYIVTIQMVTMNILTSALNHYTGNLPVLFVIDIFNILDDDICLPTCCHTLFIVFAFFVKLQESSKNSAIHRRRHHRIEKRLPHKIE